VGGKMFRRVLIFPLFIISVFFLPASHAGHNDSRPFGDYPSLDEVYAEVESLAAARPDLVSTTRYGSSVEGRPLVAFRIARRDGTCRPEALFGASIHGNEYIANRVAMGIAHRLLEGDGKDEWVTSLLDRTDFWFLPCINPDGYAKTWEMKGSEPWPRQRKNAHGVDLNRNFPLPAKRRIKIKWAGNSDPEHKNYHGPAPYSEPETKAVGDFAENRKFFAALDFHSWGGQFIPARCPNHRCVTLYKKMAKAFKSRQKHVRYYRLQFRLFDTYTGEMEDMLYYRHGALGVCIEIGKTHYNKPAYERTGNRFWLFNPVDSRFWVQNDVDASLAAIEKALELTGGKPLPLEMRR